MRLRILPVFVLRRFGRTLLPLEAWVWDMTINEMLAVEHQAVVESGVFLRTADVRGRIPSTEA